jgi:hypothetical protein
MIYRIFALLILPYLAASEPASITEVPVFASQRPCAKGCFILSIYEGPDRLAKNIGCEYSIPQNDCVCRPDLQVDADAFLKECINSACDSSTLDIISATSIYDEYCTNAGFLRKTPATTTSGTRDSPSTVTVTVTAVVRSTVTAFGTTVTVTRRASSAHKRATSPLQGLVGNLASLRRMVRD